MDGRDNNRLAWLSLPMIAGMRCICLPCPSNCSYVAKGFAEADVVLEENYRTECEIHHTPMELHGCVANWEGDRLTIWESTQGVYRVQQNVADILDLPLSKVRIIGHYMGGGFGSKLQAGNRQKSESPQPATKGRSAGVWAWPAVSGLRAAAGRLPRSSSNFLPMEV